MAEEKLSFQCSVSVPEAFADRVVEASNSLDWPMAKVMREASRVGMPVIERLAKAVQGVQDNEAKDAAMVAFCEEMLASVKRRRGHDKQKAKATRTRRSR